MIQQTIKKVANEVIAPRASEIDESDEFPWDIFHTIAEHGWLGLAVPIEYGGTGADKLTFCIVVEELAKVSLACCGIVTVQELGLTPILISGSEEQKGKYLAEIATGNRITAFALTESEAGSDVGAAKTSAVLKGDHYILNGDKCFISNGDIANTLCVFAQTFSDTKDSPGMSTFLVFGETDGLSRGRRERKMGVHGLGAGELFFNDCTIPRQDMLGQEGDGFKTAMRTLDLTRPTVAAQGVGIAQGALDYAIEYAKQRVQFGKSIASFQGLQWMIADRAIEIEAARQLCHHAARLIDEESPEITKAGAMAKCFASDVAMKTTVDAIQILGGYGYMKDHPLERMMRDAKITQIWEGTNQIQRVVISRALLQ